MGARSAASGRQERLDFAGIEEQHQAPDSCETRGEYAEERSLVYASIGVVVVVVVVVVAVMVMPSVVC